MIVADEIAAEAALYLELVSLIRAFGVSTPVEEPPHMIGFQRGPFWRSEQDELSEAARGSWGVDDPVVSGDA